MDRTGDHLVGRPVILAREGHRRWLVDGQSGLEITIDAEAAARIARADQLAAPPVAAVIRIESAPIEYRARPLPAWRVDLADGRGTRIYVDAVTGAVSARRNGVWRVYDFLWGLHIMDYRGRDDFNNALLVGFALLGVATWMTGATVWIARARRWALRRRVGAAS
jgi:Na+-transporting NADH:ubiquinone oxidoreductase subunit F